VASIAALEVQRFRNAERLAGKSGTTVNFGLKVLRALFNDARRKGIITSNPAEAVEYLPEETEERLPFDEEQVKALLAAAKTENDKEWRGMILLGYHAGLRLTDCASLSWDNLDLAGRTLTFRAKKTANRTKKNTVIALHQDIVKYLEPLATSDEAGEPLFPSLHGRKSGSHGGLSNAFNRLMQKAGIRVPVGAEKEGKGRQFRALGFHSLRHSFISRLANSEVGADVRKSFVGHGSDQIHRRYVHLDLSLQEKAIAKLPSLFERN
jgi:integrase